jgi:L-threonylcarbamoyladenylate synthase
VASSTKVKPEAPGQFPRHYAPETPLRIQDCRNELVMPEGKKIGLLAFRSRPKRAGFKSIEVLSERGDLREAAAHLFEALRRLDSRGLDVIIAEPVPARGLGLAIMDRLRKAATRSVS